MKTAIKLMTALLVSALVIPAFAQQNEKTISVYGSAEKTLEPDEIFLSISLQEYQDDSGAQVKMSKLEGNLLKVTKEVGIPAANIVVENINGYGNYGGYEGGATFSMSKMYQVRVANLDVAGKLIEKLGSQGLASVNVTYFNSTKTKQTLNELKVQALQNAKEEAESLLKAAGKKLGDLVSIEVIQDYSASSAYDGYSPYFGPAIANTSGKLIAKPSVVRYSVRVVYAIQ